ncbi:hypothetical protein PsYK624_163990 [Phanerochaete sordida]|uniref:F-box domain-containing protein n=1 Tax=Phanerochaete sordida TaxID=48140 RepID=A0A9P3LMY6_9APHY|nr:hypothetical protein PsYK624_163990 [Phanerochaete sordida]
MQPPAHAGEFAQLMSALRHLAPLQKCEIFFGQDGARDDVALSGAALAPLHTLANMRIFQLLHAPIAFEPEAVRALARAWTRLESLQLHAPMQHPGHLRLKDLTAFAEHCPSLRLLILQVSPVAGDWRCDPGVRTSTSSLVHLNLNKSIIDPLAAARVAEYLAVIFPAASVRHEFWEEQSEAAAVIDRIDELKDMLVPQGMADVAEWDSSEDAESESSEDEESE